MDKEHKEVNFKEHCKTCKHEKTDERLRPCCDCLEQPTNLYSSKPVCWEEK